MVYAPWFHLHNSHSFHLTLTFSHNWSQQSTFLPSKKRSTFLQIVHFMASLWYAENKSHTNYEILLLFLSCSIPNTCWFFTVFCILFLIVFFFYSLTLSLTLNICGADYRQVGIIVRKAKFWVCTKINLPKNWCMPKWRLAKFSSPRANIPTASFPGIHVAVFQLSTASFC